MFKLTEEQHMLQETVRSFARDELVPVAASIDANEKFPWPQVKRMAELGLMGITVSPQYGGAGMDTLAYAIAMEEVSAGCASCGVILSVNSSLFGSPIEYYGTEEQRQRWLPEATAATGIGCFALSEPGTGSDAAAQQTTAVRDGDRWILNGAKNWITNGAEAKGCLLFAIGDKTKGVKDIHAFIVPTDAPGFHVVKNEHKLGIKGSSTSQIVLENVVLPANCLLGRAGDGFKIAMSTLDGGRIGIAAQALGIARAAFEGAARYAQQRVAFGQPIAQFQAIQFMLADMATDIDAARLLVWRAASLKASKQPYSSEAAMAKLFASEMSGRVTDKALQIYGGYGYSKEFPAERHFRDARITQIYEGTSEIQRLVIARAVLNRYAL